MFARLARATVAPVHRQVARRLQAAHRFQSGLPDIRDDEACEAFLAKQKEERASGKKQTLGDDRLFALSGASSQDLAFVKALSSSTSEGAAIDAVVNRIVAEGEETEEKGFLEALGLGPFHRKASLVVTGILTAVSNEFYVLNEETFVAICLIGGFTTMHVLLREGALNYFENKQKDSLKAQNDAEDRHIAACQTLIDSQKGSGEIVAAVKAAFAEKETLVHLEAQAKAVAERNKVAKDFEARLQTLVNRKSEEETKAYKALVDKIYAEVLQTVKTDAKFQASALKYAITAITNPTKAGANPTVALFDAKLGQ